MIAATVLAFAATGATACATKGYVRDQTAQVGAKVDSLGQSLEQTQERTRQNEARIGEVDGKAQAARGAADQAQQAALAADGKAATATDAARAAGARADEVDKSMRRMIYEVVINEDSGNFKFGAATLPDEAKAEIDELVRKLLAEPQGAYFEIEGHTDNVGPKDINNRLGLQRAEAVKKYLYETHSIPLHRMNVISYGMEKPMAPNNTAQGRAQNRRVVVRVLV
jgi:outer membrane protein OmpA-like peptidoglycan-associated protein